MGYEGRTKTALKNRWIKCLKGMYEEAAMGDGAGGEGEGEGEGTGGVGKQIK